MSTTKNSTKVSASVPTREEIDAVSTIDAETVEAFQHVAINRSRDLFTEATHYVASVDARGGKRGADAEVQRLIADGLAGLTDENGVPLNVKPMSHARYSKLSGAFRAIGKAGFAEPTASAFSALYDLWNVSSSLIDSKSRDAIVASAARKRSDAARLAALVDAVKSTRKASDNDDDESVENDDTIDTPTAPADDAQTAPVATLATLATDAILDAIAELYAAAAQQSDADRIRIADAFRASADTLLASVTPADASALAAA